MTDDSTAGEATAIIKFNLASEQGIIEASQAIAQMSIEQRIPVQYLVHANRAVTNVHRLLEIKQRYLTYKAKYSPNHTAEKIPLLEVAAPQEV